MPTETRSNMSEILKVLDKRFEEFKNSILSDLFKEVRDFVNDEKVKVESFLEEKKVSLANDVELVQSVQSIKQHVNKLVQETNFLQ